MPDEARSTTSSADGDQTAAILNQLRANEDRLSLALEAGHIGTFDWDLRTNQTVWSREYEALFGLEPGTGGPIAWFQRVHRDDIVNATDAVQNAMDAGQLDAEWRIVWPDGSVHWHYVRGRTHYDESHKALGMIGVVVDITERRRAEEELRQRERFYGSLLENSSDYIAVTGSDGVTVFATGALERQLGYTPKEVVGRNNAHLVHPDDRAHIATLMASEAGGPVEFRVRHKDGSWRVIESVAKRYVDEDGHVFAITNNRDVTERVAAEAALRESEAQLTQSQKMEAVGRLAGGIAHDFNNLLTVISGYSELLIAGRPADDMLRHDAEEIQSAARRAGLLTQQLLAFSRKQVLHPQVLDLNDVVRDVNTMLARLIGEDVELRLEIATQPCPVLADVGQLQQVLLNLAVNARDAMPNGGALTIETRAMAPVEGDRDAVTFVQLCVSDTGVGMPPGVQAHIFEPFFTTKPTGEGTGLGLSTVYGIVNQSGGYIEVRSEVGRGTTFEIHLPRAHHQAAAQPLRDSKPADRGSETILLVEDEESLRRLAARVLERCGYRVLSAGDGAEALRICQEYDGEIDLVLSDVVMPGMSGPALVERVVAERPRVRTLFMSGYAGDAVTRHGVLEGSSHLLPKPFTSDSLGAKVREVLDEV